jgi:hypothetical protein
MTSTVRNRLLVLGVIWGLLLAAVPALLMTSPYQLTGFLVVGLACAAVSGSLGTLVAGQRAAKKGGGHSRLLAGVGAGALQGLVGGVVAALLIWALMAVTLSGFTLRNPVELSVLMSPRVFMGSFFVALSAFAYALVCGVLLGPIFGTLVNRTVRAGKNAAGEKEDLVVR